MNVVFDRIRDLISANTSVSKEQITLESLLTEDFGLDSLAFIELIVDVEKEFEINILHTEVEAIQTVAELVEYVRGKLAS